MPGEFTQHQRTFIEWPVKDQLCWPENYQEVCKGFATVAQAIVAFEPVTIIINAGEETNVRELCGPKIDIIEIQHNDSWFRDNGPTFLINANKGLAAVNWKFNAWGEKYPCWDLDDLVAPKLLEKLAVKCYNAPLIMEGGSIHSDGEGTLLTTRECLLNDNRNPHLNQEEIEKILFQYLDLEKIIWLDKGLFGDETDGHVDNIACFAKPGVVIIQECLDPNDPNYKISKDILEVLENTTDAKGRKLEIVKIQQPPAIYYNGERLTLSYLNFYFVNGGIILPVFGGTCSKADFAAQKILQDVFPERKIVSIESMSIVKEGGNIHCITQQMPGGEINA